jgi:hypothetical protein
MDVNVMGAVSRGAGRFGPMRKQDPQGGRIINNGSVSAQHTPRPSSYTVSKPLRSRFDLCTLSLDADRSTSLVDRFSISKCFDGKWRKMTICSGQADGW